MYRDQDSSIFSTRNPDSTYAQLKLEYLRGSVHSRTPRSHRVASRPLNAVIPHTSTSKLYTGEYDVQCGLKKMKRSKTFA
jgi:hypothetical protein